MTQTKSCYQYLLSLVEPISWYLEDPKRIQLFIQSLASGVIQIDEKGTNAKACLAFVTDQGTKDEKLEWAIKLMIKKRCCQLDLCYILGSMHKQSLWQQKVSWLA